MTEVHDAADDADDPPNALSEAVCQAAMSDDDPPRKVRVDVGNQDPDGVVGDQRADRLATPCCPTAVAGAELHLVDGDDDPDEADDDVDPDLQRAPLGELLVPVAAVEVWHGALDELHVVLARVAIVAHGCFLACRIMTCVVVVQALGPVRSYSRMRG